MTMVINLDASVCAGGRRKRTSCDSFLFLDFNKHKQLQFGHE